MWRLSKSLFRPPLDTGDAQVSKFRCGSCPPRGAMSASVMRTCRSRRGSSNTLVDLEIVNVDVVGRSRTEDGTRYYFGKQSRGAGDAAALNATQTVPVYGNHPGEQCYAGTFSTAWCQQAYLWNLAYVVDVNGNSMSLFICDPLSAPAARTCAGEVSARPSPNPRTRADRVFGVAHAAGGHPCSTHRLQGTQHRRTSRQQAAPVPGRGHQIRQTRLHLPRQHSPRQDPDLAQRPPQNPLRDTS